LAKINTLYDYLTYNITKFFKDGTFEIQVEWNHEENKEGKVTIRNT